MDIVGALAWLEDHLDHESSSLGVAAGKVEGLSLAPMVELMALLGDPQTAIPVLHVTGTNGKGSTAAMLTALLRANGLSVGTYTSPHLERLNERITRDGEPISDEDLAEALGAVAAVEDLLTSRPTWFEAVTAAALRWFADAPVDVAVVEVGLLGRYDATNVVEATVAVITNIGGDHTDFAPGWELAVATEKAGIVTPGRPVVLGPMDAELATVVAAEGGEPTLRFGTDLGVAQARLAVGGRVIDTWGPHGTHDDVVLPVPGAHQADNAAVAIAAAEELFGRALDDEVVAEAFDGLRLPGRLEVVGHQPLVVLDGAHNPDALAAVAAGLDDDFSVVGSRFLVLGMLDGRDPDAAVAALDAARADLVICTTVPGGRSMPAERLAAAAERAGLTAEVVEDPAAAVGTALQAAAEEDMVLVLGSFRLLAPARAAVAALLPRRD